MSQTFPQFIYDQWMPLPSVKSFARPLTGRTILLTGGNVGLGLEAAKHLATLGPARLIITSRSASRAAGALAQISQAGGGKLGKLECWEVELGSFDSVRALAERFAREGGGKLDLLVLSAGVSLKEWVQTPDGWEEMLQVNHLSGALLALRLLPFLLAADARPPTPRVVLVSSGMHQYVPEVPEAEKGVPSMLGKLNEKEYCEREGKLAQRYSLTKLFNMLFTLSLSERLPRGSALSVNAVDPGLCHSQFFRHIDSWRFWLFTQLLARRTEVGSRTIVYAAVGEELDGKSGLYSASCRVSQPSVLVRSERGKEIRESLWNDTIAQLAPVDPEVQKILKQYLS